MAQDVEPTDAELIGAWVRGREDAAATLVRRHTGPLARFLGAAGADDVEDLVQETFIRAFRRIESFAGRASFRTWLCSIGSNLLRDRWRRRSRRPPAVSLVPEDVVDPCSDPHAEAEAAESRRRIAAAIPTLSRMQRDVFLLRVQQDAPFADIAEALGSTPGAARVHFHQALKRLRAALETDR